MISEYLNQLEAHLKSIDIFADYSFSYKIDQDAGTLKIWINASFQGDSRLSPQINPSVTILFGLTSDPQAL